MNNDLYVAGIVGSRNFPYPNYVRKLVKLLPPNSIVVSGGAKGVDTIAENEAREQLIPVKSFTIEDWEWEMAAHKGWISSNRNERLVRYVWDKLGRINAKARVFAFWTLDPRTKKLTRGTANCLYHCQQWGVDFTLHIVLPTNGVSIQVVHSDYEHPNDSLGWLVDILPEGEEMLHMYSLFGGTYSFKE